MRCPAAFFLRCKPAADRHLCRDTALACSSTHRDENEAADPADGATSPEIWGRGAGIGKIEKGGYVDVAAQHRTTAMSPVSAFSFRPVTIRQLLRCACGDTENGETEIRQRLYDDWTSRSAAHRLGESTIYLDGAPCHRVLICGQVLCREALVGRDSAASHHRYILWWLSDTTGLICVMERSSSTSNSTIEEDEVEDAEIGAVEGQLQQSDPAKSGSFDGETAAAALPAARAEVYDRDYVVCTGRLCFLDVDGDAARVLANQTAALQASLDAVLHPSSKSYRDEKKARGERLSCWVGGSRVNISSATSGGDGAGGSALAVAPVRSEGAEKERPAATPCTHVLFPGAEAPMLSEAVEALGVVGPHPAGTRYLTPAEAAAWAEGRAPCHSVGSDRAKAAGAGAKENEAAACLAGGRGPLLCIRGQLRLATEMRECCFWWLAAMLTHARLQKKMKANKSERSAA